jgi:hypothetical protein
MWRWACAWLRASRCTQHSRHSSERLLQQQQQQCQQHTVLASAGAFSP